MSEYAIPSATNRRRKSVKLIDNEKEALHLLRAKFGTAAECAEAIGIDDSTLDRVLFKGSASPETIAKIKTAIQPSNQPANA